MLLPNNDDFAREHCSAIMILTCPDCQIKYVVKDGAIPPGGRQVRCASCKHSWHQDPEPEAAEDQAQDSIGEPVDPRASVEEAAAKAVEPAASAPFDTPTPFDRSESEPPNVPPAPPAPPERAEERQWQQVQPASAWDEPAVENTQEPVGEAAPPPPVTKDFEPFHDHEPIEQPRRKWPVFLLLALLVALAATAFWFLAPADLRARAGLASARDSQLYAVVNTGDYQRLASGNNLFSVSGRIVNSTDSRQTVPPIRAELLDATKQRVIYSWTISPPVASLDLNKSANFNSAEIDVPEGGEFIRIRVGGPA